MIQIIALRPYFDEKTKKEKVKHELLGTSPSVPELFKTLDDVIAKIPETERWNLYFTALNCLEPAKHGNALRRFKSQEMLPIDIDFIVLNIALLLLLFSNTSFLVGLIFIIFCLSTQKTTRQCQLLLYLLHHEELHTGFFININDYYWVRGTGVCLF
jgi:hypothetical protein